MNKGLVEIRNSLLEELESIVVKCETEVRGLTDDENSKALEIRKKIQSIDETIAAKKETRNLTKIKNTKDEARDMETREIERRNFEEQIRGLSVVNNGGLVPTTIASAIVKAVSNQAPLVSISKIYDIVGDLTINIQGEELTVGFVDETANTPSVNVALKTKTLKNNGIRVLTTISNQLIMDSSVDVVSEVIAIVSSELAKFMNDIVVCGAEGKVEGLVDTNNKVQMIGEDVTLEDMVSLMMAVPTHKQDNGCFILTPSVLTKIRTEALSKGVLAFGGLGSDMGMTLFGKKVYCVDKMETAKSKAVFANVAEGYAIKMPENVNITLMREAYLTQGMVGIHGQAHFDGCITNEKLVAALASPVAKTKLGR